MNSCPLVSFIIPFYMHNEYIEKAVQSIVDDTYPNKEIVIIDDGSPKPLFDFEHLLEKYRPFISIKFKRRKNLGLTKTLNELIRWSSGEYIVILASDDYLINNTTYDRVKLLQSSKKMFLLSDAEVVNECGKQISKSSLFEMNKRRKESYLNSNDLKKELILNWSISGAVLMMDKRIFDVIGWYDESLLIEDWDFYLRASSKDLILFYDRIVSAYRVHAGSTCRNKALEKKIYKDLHRIARKNINHFSFPYNVMLSYVFIKLCIKRMLLWVR